MLSDPLDLRSSPLVSVAWLAAHQADPHVRLVDVRWSLSGKKGRELYAEGHLPGATFVDLDTELAAPPGSGPGRHPIPTAEVFATLLERLGVTESTLIVAYDDAGGAIAARLWWLLRHFGSERGRVLDGGIGAFVAAGGVLSREVPVIKPAPRLSLLARSGDAVSKAEVDRLRSDPTARILDARSRDRFDGKSEPIDARPGHIPGALSAPFVDNLVAPGGVFRPANELISRYRALGALDAAAVVASCGSGVTACHTLLALTLAGRDDAMLYEGSWSDWAADPSLPAERSD